MTFNELENKTLELETKVTELEEKLEEKEDLTLAEKVDETDRLLKNHKHQGLETPLIYEGIATVSTEPSGVPPKRLVKQIILYITNGTKRLYIYSFKKDVEGWRYINLS